MFEVRDRRAKDAIERLKVIEEKWQKWWEEEHIYEADPDPSKPKFFVTFPYPYVNAFPHLGSAFTILRVDITARYKRMRGYNVLFPQGWHATGGPIMAAALRLREGDPKIIWTLLSMGVGDDELEKFKDPKYWVFYFTKGWKRDLKRYGMSIDWRREFYTTYLNPYYSKFVQWQYLRLKEKGLVDKGEHPVVWCPKEKKVVGDHDRPDEYAGISPTEAVIIKFRTEDGTVFPALTYRPETVFGVTNVWVNPEAEYLTAIVDGEKWIINEYASRELADQKHEVKVVGRVRGVDLLGIMVQNPVDGRWVPVLPASFVDPDMGTGVVMSVPAHAPFDYRGLLDLQERPDLLERYGLDPSIVRGLKPIPLIRLEGYSEIPARDAVEKRGVKSQEERWALEAATKEIYTKEYHTGILLEITGRWAGMKVSEAKEEITDWLVSRGDAVRVYTLPERVYCRCGARTHVKIVSDQWFLLYSKPEWKRLAHRAVDRMKFYPETLRAEFHKLIDWYKDWAFTHRNELGTPLPWDESWVIESLSDSTIYMAYYTIAKYLQHPEKYGIRPEQLVPEVFDYIFKGVGDVEKVSERTGIPASLLKQMREEFLYWYPVDLRISGKDLIQNHLVFFIFHHTALFEEKHWPRGIGVNGWVLLRGEKMSKQKGNFILLRQALDLWGADATRWAEIMGGGDPGLDDANFEPDVAEKAALELEEWIRFASENYNADAREEYTTVDMWFESVMNRLIAETTDHMEETKYKSALVTGYYHLQAAYRWYIRRAGRPNKDLLRKFIETQTLLIAPFAPHTAEEVWHRIGKKGSIVFAEWPEADTSKIRPEIEAAEEILKAVIEDAREIMKFVEKPRRLKVIVAAGWKYNVLTAVLRHRQEGKPLKDSIREALRELEGQVPKREIGNLVKLLVKYPEVLSRLTPRDVEMRHLKEAADFIARELGLEEAIVIAEEESTDQKKKIALPGKPALVLE
ncbi:MAG: leucine--tRNA ligase [Desulfurococcales archaeon]|nr:leucine--tRNA ligase [Desulfurococcales archaeon]